MLDNFQQCMADAMRHAIAYQRPIYIVNIHGNIWVCSMRGKGAAYAVYPWVIV